MCESKAGGGSAGLRGSGVGVVLPGSMAMAMAFLAF
jgi:hypothetical protein